MTMNLRCSLTKTFTRTDDNFKSMIELDCTDLRTRNFVEWYAGKLVSYLVHDLINYNESGF